jgi:hypothetical protein
MVGATDALSMWNWGSGMNYAIVKELNSGRAPRSATPACPSLYLPYSIEHLFRFVKRDWEFRENFKTDQKIPVIAARRGGDYSAVHGDDVGGRMPEMQQRLLDDGQEEAI